MLSLTLRLGASFLLSTLLPHPDAWLSSLQRACITTACLTSYPWSDPVISGSCSESFLKSAMVISSRCHWQFDGGWSGVFSFCAKGWSELCWELHVIDICPWSLWLYLWTCSYHIPYNPYSREDSVVMIDCSSLGAIPPNLLFTVSLFSPWQGWFGHSHGSSPMSGRFFWRRDPLGQGRACLARLPSPVMSCHVMVNIIGPAHDIWAPVPYFKRWAGLESACKSVLQGVLYFLKFPGSRQREDRIGYDFHLYVIQLHIVNSSCVS